MPVQEFVVDAKASFGLNSSELSRGDVTGLSSSFRSKSVSGNDAMVSLGLSRPFDTDSIRITPFARVTWQIVTQNGVSEGGAASVQAGQPDDAVEVLADALVLDPRRTSTWTPLGEALALSGYPEEAVVCLWIGYQWSNNRDKSMAFYISQAEKQKNSKPALAQAHETVLLWIQGTKPDFKSLGK